MKRLQKVKRDMEHPGQALKRKLQPDAYKTAKRKAHQAQNPGQTLKHKLQPDAYKKAKRRLKKLSKLKKMMKGEVSATMNADRLLQTFTELPPSSELLLSATEVYAFSFGILRLLRLPSDNCAHPVKIAPMGPVLHAGSCICTG